MFYFCGRGVGICLDPSGGLAGDPPVLNLCKANDSRDGQESNFPHSQPWPPCFPPPAITSLKPPPPTVLIIPLTWDSHRFPPPTHTLVTFHPFTLSRLSTSPHCLPNPHTLHPHSPGRLYLWILVFGGGRWVYFAIRSLLPKDCGYLQRLLGARCGEYMPQHPPSWQINILASRTVLNPPHNGELGEG